MEKLWPRRLVFLTLCPAASPPQMTPSPTTRCPSTAAASPSSTGPTSQRRGLSSSCGNWSRYGGIKLARYCDFVCTHTEDERRKVDWTECSVSKRSLKRKNMPEKWCNSNLRPCGGVEEVGGWYNAGIRGMGCECACVVGGVFWLKQVAPDRLKQQGLKDTQPIQRFVKSVCLTHRVLLRYPTTTTFPLRLHFTYLSLSSLQMDSDWQIKMDKKQ